MYASALVLLSGACEQSQCPEHQHVWTPGVVCALLLTDDFEAERVELLRAVDRCAVHQDDVHRLEWENRKRADEIKELQQASRADMTGQSTQLLTLLLCHTPSCFIYSACGAHTST